MTHQLSRLCNPSYSDARQSSHRPTRWRGALGLLLSAFFALVATAPSALAQSPNPSTFGRHDMLDAAALAQKVSGQADPVSVYVWGQSSTAAQQTMSSASASDHELQSALVETLNTLLVDNQFFTRERFAHVRLSPEVRQMTVQAPGLGDELARFNRLLLEDAYSWLRKTQPSVPERPTIPTLPCR